MAAKSFVYRAARAGLAAGSVVLYLDERGLVRPWRWVHHIVHVPALGASQPLKVDFQVLVKARPPPIGWYGRMCVRVVVTCKSVLGMY